MLLYILRVLDYDWRLIAAPMGYSTSPNEPRSTLAGADTQKRLAREEAGRHIREAREGTIFGPELTIRELISEGRGAE